MSSDSDRLPLLDRARSGDRAAFAALLERYRERLLDRIRLMLGEEARRQAESSDFVQDALLEAIEHHARHGLRDERDLLRWLTAIARNNIRDATRRRRATVFENLSGELAPGSATGAPGAEAARRESLMILLEALEQLEPDHRRVIELRTLDELPLAEVGERMERSENAARQLHARAMVQLARRVRSLSRGPP